MDNQTAKPLPVAQHVPEFDSEAAEREWWATHDTSQLPGTDVDLHHTGPGDSSARAVTVHVDEQTILRLKKVAARRGVDFRSMVRSWILDRLGREAPVT
ncbi:MAG TPA: CopG family antitoxin [Chloroflexota bacterium]|nr:CopG family antitoxin [Chloroflexota bacterium]